MALYRMVSMAFWTDNKVADDFTPEDRYFYLYLFTNPHTNLCGCYEISIKQISNETGYSKDSVENLINRFENVHKVLCFCKETKEVLLLNWWKYNWTTSEKFRKPLEKEIEKIKCNWFKKYLSDIFETGESRYGIDTPCIGTPCIDTTVTDTNTIINTNTITNTIKEIIDYLNTVLGTRYSYKTQKTQTCIKARLKENPNFTVSDFKTVIDKKYKEWKGTDMERYLRSETLFGGKFEGYLNQNIVDGKPQQQNRVRGNSRQEQFNRLLESIQKGE